MKGWNITPFDKLDCTYRDLALLDELRYVKNLNGPIRSLPNLDYVRWAANKAYEFLSDPNKKAALIKKNRLNGSPYYICGLCGHDVSEDTTVCPYCKRGLEVVEYGQNS